MVLNNIAITGASGMLGRHLINMISKKNYCAQLSSRTMPEKIPDNCYWRFWDLKEWKTFDELDVLFPDVQCLIHAGAFVDYTDKFQTLFDVNIRSCLNLAEWALERKLTVVHISSATVYENPFKSCIIETDPLTEIESLGRFYGYSKLLAEKVLLYFMNKGLKVCILRPSSIYGYGNDNSSLILKFLLLAAQDKVIRLYPPVTDRVNLIHANDVCSASLMALEKGALGIYNIAAQNVSVLDIAKTCIEVTGKGKIEIMSAINQRDSQVKFDLSYTKAKQNFEYIPLLSFNEGISILWKDLKTRL